MKMIGHVTSSYWSENCGRSIALALVAGGRDRMGDTLYVPMPNGVIEAFACGRPVVAFDAGGIKDAVRSGETGLLVPPGDADALGAAIDCLLGDEELRKRCAQGALEWAERECSADLEAARFEKLYAELAERREA